MKGRENLVPFRSTEEAREKGRKGGQKSGETRRKNKTLREIFTAVGEVQTSEKIREKLNGLGFDGDNVIKFIVASCALKVMSGKASFQDMVKFLETYASYTDQKPSNKTQLIDDDGRAINPFKDFYEAICGEKDYTR